MCGYGKKERAFLTDTNKCVNVVECVRQEGDSEKKGGRVQYACILANNQCHYSLFAREGVWESKDLLVISQALGEADGIDWKEL